MSEREQANNTFAWLKDLQNCYLEVLLQHPRAHVVLKDLARFCNASAAPVARNTKTGEIDDKATWVAIGRQEVWYHIQRYLRLSDEELWALRAPVELQSARRSTDDDEDR